MISAWRRLRHCALSAALALGLADAPEARCHGDVHARIDALTAEIAKKPEDANLYLQRGELHRVDEAWALAEADLDRAEKLNPQLATVFLARARLHLARGQHKDAQAAAEKFLGAYPKHPPALTARAQALAGQKRFVEAAEAWQEVIAAAPAPDVEHYYQRAQALIAAGAAHAEAALQTLDEGLAKLGNVPTLGLCAVELEVSRARYDAALERIDRLMPTTGRTETWRELRGDILAKAGKAEEARAEYAKALESMAALPPRTRSTKAGIALEERLRSKAKP
jgi:tetratricopeptide (TPR) repeat protein